MITINYVLLRYMSLKTHIFFKLNILIGAVFADTHNYEIVTLQLF